MAYHKQFIFVLLNPESARPSFSRRPKGHHRYRRPLRAAIRHLGKQRMRSCMAKDIRRGGGGVGVSVWGTH